MLLQLLFNTFYKIYLGDYPFKQNDESLVAHQNKLCGPQVGRGPPVEKHCPKALTSFVNDSFVYDCKTLPLRRVEEDLFLFWDKRRRSRPNWFAFLMRAQPDTLMTFEWFCPQLSSEFTFAFNAKTIRFSWSWSDYKSEMLYVPANSLVSCNKTGQAYTDL